MSRAAALDRRLVLMLACIAMIGGCLVPATARAEEAGRDGVIVAYGATYVRGESEVRHRGVDVAAASGENAAALAAGEVAFAGSVPAGTGRTMLAVTIRDDNGDLWSYLPLSALAVSAGDSVVPGDAVGSVADTGDGSSPQPHLHIGLRVSGAYVDPTPFLPAMSAPSRPDDVPETEPASPDEMAMLAQPVQAPLAASEPRQGGAAPVLGMARAPEALASPVEPQKTSQPTQATPGARLLAIDEHAAHSTRRTANGSAEAPGSGVPWGWIAPLIALVSTAGLALPGGYRRRRVASSEVLLDPGSTRLQPR